MAVVFAMACSLRRFSRSAFCLASSRLRQLGLFFGLRLFVPNRGVLVTREKLASLLLPVSGADLDNLRLRGDLFGDVSLHFRLIAGWVQVMR